MKIGESNSELTNHWKHDLIPFIQRDSGPGMTKYKGSQRAY